MAAKMDVVEQGGVGGSGIVPEGALGQDGQATEPVFEIPGSVEVARIEAGRFQPRSHFDEAKTRELAADLDANGLLEAIRVRPHPEKPGVLELVYGERRVRAARLLGWAHILAYSAPLDDATAAKMAASENKQRVDLTPFEAAESYAMLARNTGWSAQGIADFYGVEVTVVARRLKLLELSTPWQTAAMYHPSLERWPVSSFELIASYPEEMQAWAYKTLIEETESETDVAVFDDVEHLRSLSFADVRREFSSKCHVIDAAPWKLEDEKLVPAAGTCAACPKRASVNPELFDAESFDGGPMVDGKVPKGDRCLDGDCFKTKLDAFLEREWHELRQRHGAENVVLLRAQHYGVPAWAKETRESYEFEEVRGKKTKGACVALIVNGSAAGKHFWARDLTQSREDAKGSNGAAHGQDAQATESAEDVLAKVEAKRFEWIASELRQVVSDEDRVDLAVLEQNTINAYVIAHGLNANVNDEPWDVFQTALTVVPDQIPYELSQRIYMDLANDLEFNFASRAQLEGACTILGLEFEQFLHDAAREFPVPAEDADGEGEPTGEPGSKQKPGRRKKAAAAK